MTLFGEDIACETCAFWRRLFETDNGECLRFPPVVVGGLLPPPGKDWDGHIDGDAQQFATRRPVTFAHDLCGEYMLLSDDDDPDEGESQVIPIRMAA